MINEIIVTTLNEDVSAHIAPMGIKYEDGLILIAPFKPSKTLDNLLRNGQAAINITDDVRVFAGTLVGHRDWPLAPTVSIPGHRLRDTLSHIEVEVEKHVDDDIRPQFYCRVKQRHNHKPFMGFNRAQAAVLEAAILVSRLRMLPAEKIDDELKYLRIAVDKTAGEHELQAWGWLMEYIARYRREEAGRQPDTPL